MVGVAGSNPVEPTNEFCCKVVLKFGSKNVVATDVQTRT